MTKGYTCGMCLVVEFALDAAIGFPLGEGLYQSDNNEREVHVPIPPSRPTTLLLKNVP